MTVFVPALCALELAVYSPTSHEAKVAGGIADRGWSAPQILMSFLRRLRKVLSPPTGLEAGGP